MKPRIIFIHGMFLNSLSWEAWITYFQHRGFDCGAPAWPLHEGDPRQLREEVPPGLGDLNLAALHAHYRQLLAGTGPVVLIGHSIGGLLVQKLLADGIGVAGVGICSVAPNQMLAMDWEFFRNTLAITNPLAGDSPFEMTLELFHQNFGNTMTKAASDAAFETYAVHESRQVLRDILTSGADIDVKAPHPPLLLIGAEKDEIIPAPLVRRNAEAYEDERSHSEYLEFTGRGHFICGQDGWEEVALSIANWLTAHLTAQRS